MRFVKILGFRLIYCNFVKDRYNVVEDLSDRLKQKFPLQYSFLSKDLQFEVEVNSQDEVCKNFRLIYYNFVKDRYNLVEDLSDRLRQNFHYNTHFSAKQFEVEVN